MFKPVDSIVDFPKLEERILKWWHEAGIVKKYLQKNSSSKKKFSFLDGPITANNPMGVHHGWGRTYKDLWQRFNNMRGFKQRFQNGFDCQGLWVEVEVEKELVIKNKRDIENLVPGDKEKSIAKFVNLCKERVLKFSKIQTEQSKRLGYFMDWDHSYYTMSDENNYMIWHFLKTCHDKGWIYKGRESVPWCPRCQTAISQHEMLTEDYKEVVHKSIYLSFPIVGRKNEYLLVWTTTPWTIPANIAVAVDKKINYSLVKGESSELYWVAKDLIKQVFKNKNVKIVKTVKGEKLVGLYYNAPFDDLPAVSEVKKANPDTFHKVIATDDKILPILTSEGTGIVHTAVSAGIEDFKLGKKYGLPMIPVINDSADYLDNLGFLSGKNAKKHPELIFDYLEKREKENKENWVFALENYKHRYPACWRCKKELVWKVADEWYIAMDKKDQTDPKKRTLRNQMKDVAKKINWIPSFGLERELDWLSNMHDWLISKPNRYWGLALPIYECKCGHVEVVGSKEELKKKAVEGWENFEGHTPHKPWIDRVKIKCPKCLEKITRLSDVGNVWLDAGIVPYSTITENNQGKPLYLKNRKKWQEWFPIDFITESFPGQFKNWFYSMIAMSTVLERTNPFENILGFGTLLGEDGRPMHKSWGNAIEFNEGANKMGVDVMRWMYARHKSEENLLFGYKKADETRRQFHILLWNIYKFFLTQANFNNWKPNKSSDISSENILDQWILIKIEQVIKTVTESLGRYDAFTASSALESFVNDLSVWYVRRSREREDKNQLFNTLYYILVTLSKLLAPFTPFMTEEMYKNLTAKESVHLSEWPEQISNIKYKKSKLLIENMEMVRKICELGHAARKVANTKVRQPLAKITVKNIAKKPSKEYEQLILEELNIKSVEWKKGKGELAVKLEIKLSQSLKEEGEARDLVRRVQIMRKNEKMKLDDRITIFAPSWPKKFESYILDKTIAKSIEKAEKLKILHLL